MVGLQWLLCHWPSMAPSMHETACSLHCLHSDIKEVANVCNQSLMKLVIPEDDEMDEAKQSITLSAEPNPEEPVSKPEAASTGESPLAWTCGEGWGKVLRRS